MKKFFGVLFIIFGVICIPKVITPSVYGTIGGIIGICISSFIPAFFLLREKKYGKVEKWEEINNINNTNMADQNDKIQCEGMDKISMQKLTINSVSSTNDNTLSNTAPIVGISTVEDGTLYESLFDELKIKCDPVNFLNVNGDYEKSKIANSIYRRVIENSNNIDVLIALRKEATSKLGISFSVAHIYGYLLKICNPQIYTGENYDHDKFNQFIDLHKMVSESKSDIEKLENLYIKICEVLNEDIKIYNGRETEILMYDKSKKAKAERIIEDMEQEERRDLICIATILIITIIIIGVLIIIAEK